MAYYNRKLQLYNTLFSIHNSSIKDLEIIITDDASREEERIEDLVKQFDIKIKIIRINPEEKTWVNPCIAYNMAIKLAEGKFIMIQNPECFHFGDVIKHFIKNIKNKTYCIYSVFGFNAEYSNILSEKCKQNEYKDIVNGMEKYIPFFSKDNYSGIWYNHARFRKRPYHFLSGMNLININRLRGFNEKFSQGHWFDDDEFFYRCRKIMSINNIPPMPIGIHQEHISISKLELIEINRKIYKNICK